MERKEEEKIVECPIQSPQSKQSKAWEITMFFSSANPIQTPTARKVVNECLVVYILVLSRYVGEFRMFQNAAGMKLLFPPSACRCVPSISNV